MERRVFRLHHIIGTGLCPLILIFEYKILIGYLKGAAHPYEGDIVGKIGNHRPDLRRA
jgi:hypothetical protein